MEDLGFKKILKQSFQHLFFWKPISVILSMIEKKIINWTAFSEIIFFTLINKRYSTPYI